MRLPPDNVHYVYGKEKINENNKNNIFDMLIEFFNRVDVRRLPNELWPRQKKDENRLVQSDS